MLLSPLLLERWRLLLPALVWRESSGRLVTGERGCAGEVGASGGTVPPSSSPSWPRRSCAADGVANARCLCASTSWRSRTSSSLSITSRPGSGARPMVRTLATFLAPEPAAPPDSFLGPLPPCFACRCCSACSRSCLLRKDEGLGAGFWHENAVMRCVAVATHTSRSLDEPSSCTSCTTMRMGLLSDPFLPGSPHVVPECRRGACFSMRHVALKIRPFPNSRFGLGPLPLPPLPQAPAAPVALAAPLRGPVGWLPSVWDSCRFLASTVRAVMTLRFVGRV
mmetsp:Transcript_8885/g.23955  ORF Transcript_8885/g.23955 Transcript_8885/m.23955 type:complete len:280 (-) Transcript_8885:3418-4257(-)